MKNCEKRLKTVKKDENGGKTAKAAKNDKNGKKRWKNGQKLWKMAKIILGAASKFFFALGTGLLLSCTRWTSLDSTQGHRVQVHDHEYGPGQGGHELKLHEKENKYIDAKI